MGSFGHRYRKRAGTAALPLGYGREGLSGAARESSPAAESQDCRLGGLAGSTLPTQHSSLDILSRPRGDPK